MQYAKASIATDICIFTIIERELHVLLIDRKEKPLGWALPGGFFIPDDKNLDECATRELWEETHVTASKLFQFGIYSEANRDSRYPRIKGKDLGVVSVAYFALVPRENLDPKADTDAKDTDLKPISKLPKLAFDHKKIILDGRDALSARALDDQLLLQLMPDSGFSISQLRDAYEAVGKTYTDAANFQRHVKTKLIGGGLIEDTNKTAPARKGGPPARLYRYTQKSIRK